MPEHNHYKLTRYCASIANLTRLAVLNAVAKNGKCLENEIVSISGLGKFAVGLNLKGLKKIGLIKGSLGVKNTCYCIDYEKLDEFKQLFDDFYNSLIENKTDVDGLSCHTRKNN